MGITFTVHVVSPDFDLSKVKTFRDVASKAIVSVDMDKWNSFELFLSEDDFEEGGCIKEVPLADLLYSLTNHLPEDRSLVLVFNGGNTTVEKEFDPMRTVELKAYAQEYLGQLLPYSVGGYKFILIAG